MLKRKTIINLENAATLFAIIASLGTLIIVVYQTNLMGKQYELQREEQHASVMPYLTIGNSDKNNFYTYGIWNNGLGPAFIKEINIIYKDSICRNHDVYDFFMTVIRKEDSLFVNAEGIGHATTRVGTLIPSNEKLSMLQMYRPNYTQEQLMAMRSWLNNKIYFEIIYESVYKEKWKILSNKEVPIKLE